MAPLAKRIGTRATSRRKCKYSGSQLDLLPAFTAFSSDWLLWGFVSGYRCATAPDSHRIPCHFRGQSPEKSRFGKQDASRNWKTPRLLLLDVGAQGDFLPAMLREVLKSKLHRAMITGSDVDYEGSIEIPTDLMEAADLWAGEKVLVASITTGARLETYVLAGKPGTGHILINGGAAHLIKAGERVAIMCFALSETPVASRNLLLDEKNNIVRKSQ